MLMWMEYPHCGEEWCVEEQLLHEVENVLLSFSCNNEAYIDDVKENQVKIPLFELIYNNKGQYTTVNEIA